MPISDTWTNGAVIFKLRELGEDLGDTEAAKLLKLAAQRLQTATNDRQVQLDELVTAVTTGMSIDDAGEVERRIRQWGRGL